MTWMIEGTWSGYRDERIVHRHYTTNPKQAKAAEDLGYGIRYGDGTTLILTVTELKPYARKLPVMDSYKDLIESCCHYKVCSVDDLVKARTAIKQAKDKPTL